MNIKITSEAVEAFKEDYEDDLSTTGFRLYLADKSWVGPRIRMVLEEPDDGDYELVIDGIKVYYCDEVTTLAKSLVIDYKSSFFRKKFFVEQIE